MAIIKKYPVLRHLQSSPSVAALVFRNGQVVRSGRGLSLWFHPLNVTVAEIPLDDREVAFLFHARTADFQDVTVQGSVIYRVADVERIAQRVDFTVDLTTGAWVRTPLERLAEYITQMAQQSTLDRLARITLGTALTAGLEHLREPIETAGQHASVVEMGIAIVAVRVSSIRPTSVVEQALETPSIEALRQEADQAVFERRALAVQKERAIAENELQNDIELARQREHLVTLTAQNDKLAEAGRAEAVRQAAQGRADETRILAEAESSSITLLETAKVDAERVRLEIYRDMPTEVMSAITTREFAKHLKRIDHLNIGGDQLLPLIADLMQAQTRKINGEPVVR